MKKMLSMTLALVLCLSLIGSATAEVTELRWLSSQIGASGEAEWFSGVIEGFNAEFEGRIKINVDGVADEAMKEKLKTDAVSNTILHATDVLGEEKRDGRLCKGWAAEYFIPFAVFERGFA